MDDMISRKVAIDQLHQSYNLLDAERRLEDLPSAQPEQRSFSCGQENDLISRHEAIDAFMTATSDGDKVDWCKWVLNALPSAQPEVKPIDYRDCANALLKMWLDNILTDGEYTKIIGKLNAHQLEMQYLEEGEPNAVD